MDLQGFRFLIFISSVSSIGGTPKFHTETYNGYTLVMPLMDNDTRIPMTSNSSFAKQWCSSINSTLPRIIDESDQKHLFQFIRNVTRKYQLTGMENIFVNNINHTIGNWTWVNGQPNQGFTVKQVGNGADGYFFGYLWTNDYSISESRPLEPRKYICETSAQSSNSSRCEMKLDKRCYWKKDAALSWYKARETCINEGGDLASFEKFNNNTLNIALKDLGLIESRSYWVGISKSIWRWNDTDSEIKYSSWIANHPSNYSAKCLCLNNDYEWTECDCDKSYPFICKRNGTWAQIPFSTNEPLTTTIHFKTTVRSLPMKTLTTTSVNSETTVRNLPMDPLPMNPLPNTSVISETVKLTLVLSSCAVIVVIIILVVAAFIIRKQTNRSMGCSTRDETSEEMTTATTNEFPLYAQVKKPTRSQSATNWSSSNTTYANVETIAKSNTGSIDSVYHELDILPES